MVYILFGRVILQALVMALLLYLIARHEADYSFHKVLWVITGITVINWLMEWFMMGKPWWVIMPLQFAFAVVIVATFCWIRLWKAIVVVLGYSGVQGVFAVVVALMVAQPAKQPGSRDYPYSDMENPGVQLSKQISDLARGKEIKPPSYKDPEPPPAVEQVTPVPPPAPVAPEPPPEPEAVVLPAAPASSVPPPTRVMPVAR